MVFSELLALAALAIDALRMPSDATITLRRTGGYIGCPVYEVVLAGDGTVRWSGTEAVARVGVSHGKADREALDDVWREIGGWRVTTKWDDNPHWACKWASVDGPSYVVTIVSGGASVEVAHPKQCGGDRRLDAFLPVVAAIDNVAHTEVWVGEVYRECRW